MKKLLNRLLAMLLCATLIYSAAHRPTEQDFNRWLKNEYGLSCGPASCTMKDQESDKYRTLIITGSRTKDGYLLFNTISRTFEGKEGKQTVIKAIGFLGSYYTLVEESDHILPSG
ncbi:hypothetical protein FZC79_16600 [Rossellomorea vietnamensis]|uniref:Uncharacterized protein n=1 Tax=Rossellomorea vietnamensis TaxID=218284 RepID=A0A5D4KBC1_9BACI|nr:hypothetical protein [Rossellomorea vietnamensis]TYR74070.1 hypothetical protein FZC79_16600 [Rossellomorea vietnamensis]